MVQKVAWDQKVVWIQKVAWNLTVVWIEFLVLVDLKTFGQGTGHDETFAGRLYWVALALGICRDCKRIHEDYLALVDLRLYSHWLDVQVGEANQLVGQQKLGLSQGE